MARIGRRAVGGSRLTQEQKDRKFAKVRGLDVDWFMGLSRKDRRFIKDQQARVKAAKIGRRWNVEFTDGREEESNHFDLLPISGVVGTSSSPMAGRRNLITSTYCRSLWVRMRLLLPKRHWQSL
jgi:hypothetical protein